MAKAILGRADTEIKMDADINTDKINASQNIISTLKDSPKVKHAKVTINEESEDLNIAHMDKIDGQASDEDSDYKPYNVARSEKYHDTDLKNPQKDIDVCQKVNARICAKSCSKSCPMSVFILQGASIDENCLSSCMVECIKNAKNCQTTL